MTRLLTLTSALALSLGLAAQTTQAQGRGEGQRGEGRGQGAEQQQDRGEGRGRGQDRDDGERDRGRGGDDDGRGRGGGGDDDRDDRGRGQDRGGDDRGRVGGGGDDDDGRRGGGDDDRDDGGRDRPRGDDGRQTADRDRWDGADRGDDDDDDRWRRVERRPDGSDIIYLVRDRDRGRGLINGCPPGLAWRDNGCLPPGQARRIERERDDWWWNRRDDDDSWRYSDGYAYRTGSDGALAGFIPLLAGALGLNNVWPTQYAYEPAPQYYSSYYGLDDGHDYRYADGVIYGIDPRTQRIDQVSALLTGDPWTVGQRMPAGYDVYNVPYAYRDQYADGSDSLYRYNDGRVYQVDPTTQLVQAVIQLIT